MSGLSSTSKTPLERAENGKPRFHGCSKIQEYEFLGKLGEGTFGEVSKARSKKTRQIVALKKILMHNEKDGFPITALREIKLLKQLDHINVLKLEEMAVERSKDTRKKPIMYMVTPYMDHDLSGLLENPNVHFSEPQIKCYMMQLLEGVKYLHENKILHRDMKAANLLINNHGILQIADFGLARSYDDNPPKPGEGGGEATREYTTLVVTRWYRPPELLLQLRRYTTAIDMWGVGCVFGEMFKGKPILAGNSDINQIQQIFDLVGSPTEDNMPGWSELPGCEGVKEFAHRNPTLPIVFRDQGPLAISLLSEFLKLDWRKRINAIDALQHPYFQAHPLPAKPGDIPQFEESHELDRRKFRGQKAALPPAPAGGSVGIGAQGEWGINGRPIPYDQRHGGGGRVPINNGNAYANGHGPSHGRRPPPPHTQQHGPYEMNYRGPQPPYPQNAPYHRPPPPYEQPPHHNNRMPPGAPRDFDDPYSRRPPPPDLGLPPKPPPSSDQYWHGPPQYRGDHNRMDQRRDHRGPPPPRDAQRIPPSRNDPKVDTYIPNYNKGLDRDRDRDRAAPPVRGVDDYPPPPPPRRDDNTMRRAGPVPPPQMDGRGRYDERYDDGPGLRGGGVGGGVPYDRRRSRSPQRRDWDRGPRDLERERMDRERYRR